MAESVSKVVWAGRVISGLASVAFLFSAYMKLQGGPEVVQGMGKLGLPEPMLRPLALLELSCVAIYLFPPTAVLGAILLAGYMGGAICTHWRAGEHFEMQAAIGVAVWLGIYLREARLRRLLPLRIGSQ